jgi:hypothetical protein
MKSFVFWTGILDLLAGIGFQISHVSRYVLPSEPAGLTMRLFGMVTVFLGVMLVVCSRDLERYARLVAWEGLLRLCGFALFAGYGIFGTGGVNATACGVADLAIGVAYLIGLPQSLQMPLRDLLLGPN